jgi:hypothetical protein
MNVTYFGMPWLMVLDTGEVGHFDVGLPELSKRVDL